MKTPIRDSWTTSTAAERSVCYDDRWSVCYDDRWSVYYDDDQCIM